MSDEATGFVGSIPENYDRGLGPIFFADYAEHTARLVANCAPSRVLETGAGTGIVTLRLRDLSGLKARRVRPIVMRAPFPHRREEGHPTCFLRRNRVGTRPSL